MNILFTLCGRAGSKGVKGKNVRNFLDIPLAWYSVAGISLYIEKYGSSENTKGNVATYYAKEVPKEWLPREMPASLKTSFWGKAVVHSTKAKVYFYPGTPSINYHKKRMELMSAEDSQVPVADSERSSMPAGSRGYILFRARTFISLMQETSKWIFRP